VNEQDVRQAVSDAGRRLKASGLIAGTWGNISIKLDDIYMIVTPSGMDYEIATSNDMVKVNYHDNSYEGKIKPSSEMKLHTEIYRSREGINAVIHTHSMNASSVAAARSEVPVILDKMDEVLGGPIKVAKYALPSTKKIVRETVKALVGRKGALMANHGAIGIGKDLEEAFETCQMVEYACRVFIESKAGKSSKSIYEVNVNLKYNLLELSTIEEKKRALCNAHAQLQSGDLIGSDVGSLSLRLDDVKMLITPQSKVDDKIVIDDILEVEYLTTNEGSKDTSDMLKIHSTLYRAKPNIDSVVITNSNNGKAVSQNNKKMGAILDDMVQIIGPNVRVVETDTPITYKMINKINRGIRRRNGVLTTNHGSITVGHDLEEAFTACIVMEKAYKTCVDSKYLGGAKSINILEAILMRQFYLLKYSKQRKITK
jgi:L-fuculose-phosphate aldolase